MFVESDKLAVDALKANLAKLEIRGDVRATSVMALGPAPAPLDVILMDPPYATGAGLVALDKLSRLGWVGPATWISLETAKAEVGELAGFEVDLAGHDGDVVRKRAGWKRERLAISDGAPDQSCSAKVSASRARPLVPR